ncbi:hypothetical protein KBC31_02520 [Candidatus Saccharibacteria bacterium]|nr:hypothetical protein [Candidatus Saccharibacteria bacterium]
MNKDIIYIDTDDEITDIIGRVKDSQEKIIALVPPKRIGALGSVVNLRLLKRAADSSDKRLVAITQDKQLIGLAAGVGLFVADNLQSRPVVPMLTDKEEIPSDVIMPGDNSSIEGALGDPLPSLDDDIAEDAAADTIANDQAKKKGKGKKSSNKKNIPQFDKFRKRLVFTVLGLIIFAGFFVWAIFFAPRATVTITTKTSKNEFSKVVKLDPAAKQIDAKEAVVPAIQLEKSKQISEKVIATGEKNVGQQAGGTLTIKNCSSSDPIGFKSNTAFVGADGKVFFSTESISVSGAGLKSGKCKPGTGTVSVIAEKAGAAYNSGAQSYTIRALSGDDAKLFTVSGSQMNGGTDEVVKIIKQSDIDQATQSLLAKGKQQTSDELKASVPADARIVGSSLQVTNTGPIANPVVGEPVDTGSVEAEFSATQLAVKEDILQKFIKKSREQDGIDADKKQADNDSKGLSDSSTKTLETGEVILDYGLAKLTIEQQDGGYRLATELIVGPEITTSDLAEKLIKKPVDESVTTVEAINGVTKAEVKTSPFWVNKMPRKATRITIKQNLTGEGT